MTSFVGCFGEDEEQEETCQSGRTYQLGFRNARLSLETPVCIWENVRDVLFARKDDHGVKHAPEVETVVSDMLSQGCHFAYYQVDTSRYLLPQRRNRVYGIVSQDEQRSEKMSEDYEAVMQLFESFRRLGFFQGTYIHMFMFTYVHPQRFHDLSTY